MKKVISLVLVIVMLCSSFAGLQISANADLYDQESLPSVMPDYPEEGQQFWVIFNEGYRDNRLEMSTFDVSGDSNNVSIVWDGGLYVSTNGDYSTVHQFHYTQTEWIYDRNYSILTDYATRVLASNVNIYDNDGTLLLKATTLSNYPKNGYILNNEVDNNIFSGPDNSFARINTKVSKLNSIISVEGDYCEIDFISTNGEKNRGYVKKSLLPDTDFKGIPVVKNSIPTAPTTQEYILKLDNVSSKTIEETSIYSGPGSEYAVREKLPSGTIYNVVYFVESNTKKHALIQYTFNNELKRGYILKTTFEQSVAENREKNNYNNCKESNAKFLHNSNYVYSAFSGTDSDKFYSLGSYWAIEKSYGSSKTDFNFWDGVVAVFKGNETSDDEIKPGEYSAKEKINSSFASIEMTIDFFSAAVENTRFKFNIEKHGNDKRLIILSGVPIEKQYAGQSFTGKEVLYANHNYTLSEDEFVRNLFPDFVKEGGKYSIDFNFTNDYESCGYGYSMVVKKDGTIYSYPIFHGDTSFPVYRTENGKKNFEFDAVNIYKRIAFQVDDSTAKFILNELKNNNIFFHCDNHNLRSSLTKPTTTTLGFTTHTCTRCTYSYVDYFTAPTGKLILKHNARTANALNVSWNNVSTATGYQVQISTKDGKNWDKTVTLKAGVTSYTFKKIAAGNNYKFRVRFYIKAPDGKNCFSPWSATLGSPTLPTGTTLTKLTPAKKAFNAQWKKNAAVNGYQIQYSLKSNFSGAKTITVKSPKTLKAAAKKLNAKKVYYVRIRTYKTISKVNYFSTWSKTYKVKTK